MVWLCRAVLKPRKHVNLFCTMLQFGHRYWGPLKEREEEEIVHEEGE